MRVPLTPPPGLVSDDTAFAAEGAWEDGSNIRFWRGKPQTVGGWALFSSTLAGVCRNLLAWTDTEGVINVAFGAHNSLAVERGGMLHDITPAGLVDGAVDSASSAPGYGSGPYGAGTYSTPALIYYLRTWSLDNWGETLLGAPRGGTLYQWDNDVSSAAAAVANAPAEINAMLVTAERQCLALGCNEEGSGIFNPLCIRGCDIEDLTDWTTSSANNGFEHILEGGGHIVTGRRIGPYIAVWTDNALQIGQFLGNPGQAYRFDRVDDNCGLIGPNAVHVVGQTAFWVAPDRQFRMWAPGSKPRIIPCPIRKDFADHLDGGQAQKIAAAGISQFAEIWWFYPDMRDGSENSRYVAFSTEDGNWFRGQLSRTAFCDAGVSPNPVGVSAQGAVYHHESGESADGDDLDWRLKSADQYLGNGEQFLQLQGIWPDFEEQQGNVNLTIHVRKYPQAEAAAKGPYTLAAGAGKRDFRATGRIASVEFSGTGFVRFGKPSFEAVVTGRN